MMMVMMMITFTYTAVIAAIVGLRNELLHYGTTNDARAEKERNCLRKGVHVVGGIEVVVRYGELDSRDEAGQNGSIEESAKKMHIGDMR